MSPAIGYINMVCAVFVLRMANGEVLARYLVEPMAAVDHLKDRFT